MVKETKGPGIVITLGYTDGENLIDIPPKEKDREQLKMIVMTSERLEELENDTMTICKAEATSEQDMAKVATAKRYGMTEMPAGRLEDRDDGR